jgi:hypothetical protein
MTESGISRRHFMEARALASAATTLAEVTEGAVSDGPSQFFHASPIPVVRVGFVGVGLQGTAHVKNFLDTDRVGVLAVCDIAPGERSRPPLGIIGG